MEDPVLVILCAGKSSRFGRPKQIEPVGPRGQFFLDYTITYGIEVGFKRIVVVGRRGVLGKISQHLKAYRKNCRIEIVVQKNKYAGTAYAVLDAYESAKNLFKGPIDVFMLNGDDYYARETLLMGFDMTGLSKEFVGGIVAYEVQNCLPPAGSVNRALIKSDSSNQLIEITETSFHITSGLILDDKSKVIDGTNLVSMNAIYLKDKFLSKYLKDYLVFDSNINASEKGLVLGIEWFLRNKPSEYFRVSAVKSHWTGLTHPNDLELVKSYLANI